MSCLFPASGRFSIVASRSTFAGSGSIISRSYSRSKTTMKLQTAIVGMPNVGKSTLFNALTDSQSAEMGNYPFCTIEPNCGMVTVPDEKLERLGELSKSEKIVPATLEFVDVAGLIKGASQGEGLGNQFLASIRQCDAIVHVVRCFEDDDIIQYVLLLKPCRHSQNSKPNNDLLYQC